MPDGTALVACIHLEKVYFHLLICWYILLCKDVYGSYFPFSYPKSFCSDISQLWNLLQSKALEVCYGSSSLELESYFHLGNLWIGMLQVTFLENAEKHNKGLVNKNTILFLQLWSMILIAEVYMNYDFFFWTEKKNYSLRIVFLLPKQFYVQQEIRASI